MNSVETTVLRVNGMTCDACARRVEGALRRVEGVGRVSVDRALGRATVEHDGVPASDLALAATKAGYRSEVEGAD